MADFYFSVATILLIGVTGGVLISFLTYSIRKHRENYVAQNSSVIPALQNLNEKYKDRFDTTISKSYQAPKRYKNKASFEKGNTHDILFNYISNNKEYILHALELAEANKKINSKYLNEFKEIYKNRTTNWHKRWNCEKIEHQLVSEIILNPVITISITVVKLYTSPKGQNDYRYTYTANQKTICETLAKIEQEEKRKESKQYQRTLITPSLRYDILQRDNFTCVLCGATAKDGAKLHVDHIKPISKGGKTEMNNLRTLCETCNLGKRDKYTEEGLN